MRRFARPGDRPHMQPINPVLAALAQARARTAPLYARWCELNGAPFCPARPGDVAHFVSDCAQLGIERLWAALQDISKCHGSFGLADPTLGTPVAAAVSDIAGIDPPRSWSKELKQRFRSLPYDVQALLAFHEAQREKALRRAQNEAAAARQKLAASRQAETTVQENHLDEASQRSDT